MNYKHKINKDFECMKCGKCLNLCCNFKSKKFAKKNRFDQLKNFQIYEQGFSNLLIEFINDNLICEISEEEWIIKNIIE